MPHIYKHLNEQTFTAAPQLNQNTYMFYNILDHYLSIAKKQGVMPVHLLQGGDS